MAPLQVQLASLLAQVPAVGDLMRLAWSWPLAESLHFIGLSLLLGTVGVLDLRLLGLAPRIPPAALHRLVPFGLAGFGLNLVTGLLFLMTEPDQYIYNPSFLFKMLFVAGAGANALVFYLTLGPRALAADAPPTAIRRARLVGAVSLGLWMAVIVAGRLLTFYRPFDCGPGEGGAILLCVPGRPPS